MQTKKDISYGVIPIIKDAEGWKVFLIYQYGSKGDVYWTFPKGHPEEGETPEESALRELQEETALTLEKLDTTKTYVQSYTFPFNEYIIEKSVVYYVGFIASKAFTIQVDEVQEAGWFTFEAALARLTHDPARKMFEEVIMYIEQGK